MTARSRRGMTLLELVLATTLLATMVGAVGIITRTGHTAWSAAQSDAARLASAGATARHIVRHVRQAQTVAAISSAGDTSGSLSLVMPSGETIVWEHDTPSSEVRYGVDAADSLLAEQIEQLSFTGYEADGVTETTDTALVQAVRCTVQVQLDRDSGATRSISCFAWRRCW